MAELEQEREPEKHEVVINWKIEFIEIMFDGERPAHRVSPELADGQWRLVAVRKTGDPYIGLYLHPVYCRGDEELGSSDHAWKRRGAITVKVEVLDWNGEVDLTREMPLREYTSAAGWGIPNLMHWEQIVRTFGLRDTLHVRVTISMETIGRSVQARQTAIPAYLLDDPENGNVVFEVRHGIDEEAGHIIASKSILSRRSEYFRTLFESGFSESFNRVQLDPANLNLKPKIRDEDDMTPFEPEFNEAEEAESPSSSASPTPSASEDFFFDDDDLPAADSVKRRRPSDASIDDEAHESEKSKPLSKKARLDSTEAENKADDRKNTLQTFLKIDVHDTPFTAFRGVIGYLYTNRIPFLALASDWLEARQDALAEYKHSFGRTAFLTRDTTVGFSFSSREDWLKRKFRRLKGQPGWEGIEPCSPHAVYRLADRYGLDDLRDLALQRIVRNLTSYNVAYELFSPLSFTFDKVQQELIKFVFQNWDDIKVSDAFQTALIRITDGSIPDGLPLLRRILAETTIVENKVEEELE